MLHEDKNFYNNKGQVALIAVIIASAVMVGVVVSISSISITNYEIADSTSDSVQAYFLAESGIEDTLIRIQDNADYAGGDLTTPIGRYVVSIAKNDDDYHIRSEGYVGDVVRVVEVDVTVITIQEEITKYAVFGGDDVWMYWSDSMIRGDLWSNDDINFTNYSVIYGNVHAAGKGGFFTSWITTGAEIRDNPDTPEVVEGDVRSYNTLKVFGGHIYGDAYSENNIYVLPPGVIEGDQYQNYDLDFSQLTTPVFDYETYKQIALDNGTYFHNANQFETYVNSLDDGITRTLPDGVYYIDTGNAFFFDVGNKIVLNGTIITQGVMQYYCGLEINAQNNLPALVAAKDIELRDYGWPQEGGDFVTINGVVYSERDIILKHDDSGKTITITGAAWGGDDLHIEESATVIYDPDVVNTEGFGFAVNVGEIQLQSWDETL